MLRTVAIICCVLLVFFGLSYLQERPKYAFAAEVEAGLRAAPWTRPIGTLTTADFISPATWVWPTRTTWRVAQPMIGDGSERRRFQETVITFGSEPRTYLLDVDCRARTVDAADVNQPPTAQAMFNALGEPVRDTNGGLYRYIVTEQPWPEGDIRQFCDTDWNKERRFIPK